MDPCEIKDCRAEADLTYLGRGICTKHWDQLTADDASPTLREVLGIEAAPVAAMEEAMEPTSTSKTSTKAESETSAPRKPKATKKPIAPKATKSEKIELPVVFAFRLSETDRTRIHDAAGPAKATKFVRAAALAAANADLDAFKQLIASRVTK